MTKQDHNKIKPQADKTLSGLMIGLYCQGVHKSKDGLCADCAKLVAYSEAKLATCPYLPDKPFCSSCPTPCYDSKSRAAIRAAMRYSGPRLLFKRPVALFKYLVRKK